MIEIIYQDIRLIIFKNCLLSTTKILKNGNSKYVYSGYGIAFYGDLVMTLLGML